MRWDAVLHPVGPLPVATYWIRRALVLGGTIVVLVLIGFLAGASGGSKAAKPTRAGIDLPTPGLSPTSASSPSASSPSASPPAPLACAPEELKVSVATAAPSYPSGSLPQFIVTVANTGSASCTRDVGPGSAVITVVSGSDRIWSSADCPDVKADERTLAPRAAVKLTSSWNRKRSVPGCATTGAAGQSARSGVYVASVKLGTVAAPGSASFHLS